MTRYSGTIAAAYTPFDAKGGLDLDRVPALADHFRATGVTGAFVAGTTGEWPSLTVEERKALAARWVEVGGMGLPALIHVGHACQRDSIDLAAHAEAIEASAIGVIAPSFLRPRSVGDLVDYFVPIGAAAPTRHLYVYDIPALTGVDLPTHRVLAGLRDRGVKVAGVKFTRPDLHTMQACLADGFEVLYGNDESLLAALALGVRGAIGSTYNYAAPLYRDVFAGFARGDLGAAREAQLRSVALVEVLLEFGVLAAGKAIMAMMGLDCGPTRPPLEPLDAQRQETLRERLRGIEGLARPLADSPAAMATGGGA